MSFIKNLLLFIVVFLPLTYIVALPGELYQGRFASAVENSQFYNWIGVAVPLVLPCFAFVILFHLVVLCVPKQYAMAKALSRNVSLLIFPLGFLIAHLSVWGTDLLSWQLLTIILIPGLVYGALSRWPKSLQI